MNLEFTRAPHRGRNEVAVQHNAALLIDFDNVTMGIRSNLGQELRNLLDSEVIRGKVAVQRAYADWRRYPQYIVPLSESSIDLIFAPAYGSSKKNATDIRLAIDALELVFTRPEIGTFILLSGDSDFSSLVLKLKEYGKYVIGVGLQESSSDILVQNCDEYYSYNRLSGLMSADEAGAEKHDPWTLVGRAVTRMAKREDVMRSDRLKQVMLEIDPSFDEKTAGFNKFNRFLAEAAHKDLVRLRKGENGQYEVAPGQAADELGSPAAAPREEVPKPQSRSRRGRRGGSRSGSGRGSSESRAPAAGRREEPETPFAEAAPVPAEPEPAPSSDTEATFEGEMPAVALRKAYEELATVVEALFDGEPVRDSMAKRKLLERDETFDEGSLGFRKFSRFLRQASDEGIVDLTQGEDGNYYLRPVEGADAHPSRTRDRGRERAPRGRERQGRDDRATRDRSAPEDRTAARVEEAPAEAPAEAQPAAARIGGDGAAPESALSAAKAAARRTIGRFRRGSKGSGGPDSDSQAPRIGPVVVSPVDEPPTAEPRDREAGREAGGAGRRDREAGREVAAAAVEAGPAPETHAPRPSADRAPAPPARTERAPERGASAPERSSSAPERSSDRGEAAPTRGMGRFRSGSRGRSGAAKPGSSSIGRIGPVTPSPREADASATPDDRGAARPEASARAPVDPSPAAGAEPADGHVREAVDHMIRHYPGVGRRTAEALVDRFGPDVFEVIDRDPDRLNEVISEGRARAVIEARKEERED